MITKPKRRRRKRKSRYHTGVFVSVKTGQSCKYRSGWELSYLQWLEVNPDVLTFAYESLKIPYLSNVRSGKIRNYIPDVLVEMTSGAKLLVEIKPSRKLVNAVVKKKIAAAELYCYAHGLTHVIITEKELKLLGLL